MFSDFFQNIICFSISLVLLTYSTLILKLVQGSQTRVLRATYCPPQVFMRPELLLPSTTCINILENTGGPRYMQKIGTRKIGEHIMNSHIKRPQMTIKIHQVPYKRPIFNHIYAKSHLKRPHITRSACKDKLLLNHFSFQLRPSIICYIF